jgi:glycosyltransferase involved in cell wall biosynthesis
MADICLLVEGAYPYVTGGVSSWIQALITHMPDFSFSVQYIGTNPDPHRKPRYRFPENMVEFREIFLHDTSRLHSLHQAKHPAETWQAFHQLHEAIALGTMHNANQLRSLLRQPNFAQLTLADLFYARESWDLLEGIYQEYAADQSFMDFFWTFRLTYLPIFSIFEASLPQASVYHAVSTGFSGLLGSLARLRNGSPFLITEHGLYTREREIEIMQSAWIYRPALSHHIDRQRLGFFQQWWLNIFRFMEEISYDTADSILSITSVNQQYQLKRGANPDKMQLISNGVDIQRFAGLRKHQPVTTDHFQVGFVGRIVPIKDVKTLIRALKIASLSIPHLDAYLVGPTDEDPHYFQEVQQIINLLDLTNVVHFTGSVDVRTYYGQLDVIVLTSLSEGQPLVIMEANAAGVPVIATDVGACRELLQGISPEDQAFGPSGLITPVTSPQATAEAIIQLWRDQDLRLRMGRAGEERTRRFYRQEQLYSAYRELYHQTISRARSGKAW